MSKESKTFPILTTERLTLRQLSKSDSEAILQLRSNPEINKFLDRKPSKTLEDALNFIKNITENERDENFYPFEIVLSIYSQIDKVSGYLL